MIGLKGIYTIRDIPQPHYWEIVFEWEDQMVKSLGVPLKFVGKKYGRIYQPSLIRKLLNRCNAYQLIDRFLFKPTGHYLAFHIGPPGVYSFYTRKDVIPVIIDFWKSENVRRFEEIFKQSVVVFVTSLEVFNYLKSLNLHINLQHLSLSLPDKDIELEFPGARDIDIIQIGRSNSILNEYMSKFLEECPDTHYVYAEKIDNQLQIISNKSGAMGIFKGRDSFLTLLKRSKISLVSAPGLDNDKTRTGGFSPVTPRFLESAACGCRLIGIYPQNEDFDFYAINEVCESVTNYNQFKIEVSRCLSPELAAINYNSFLKRHTTSRKAIELLTKLAVN